MATAAPPTSGFKKAPQKPSGDVTDTMSMFIQSMIVTRITTLALARHCVFHFENSSLFSLSDTHVHHKLQAGFDGLCNKTEKWGLRYSWAQLAQICQQFSAKATWTELLSQSQNWPDIHQPNYWPSIGHKRHGDNRRSICGVKSTMLDVPTALCSTPWLYFSVKTNSDLTSWTHSLSYSCPHVEIKHFFHIPSGIDDGVLTVKGMACEWINDDLISIFTLAITLKVKMERITQWLSVMQMYVEVF